MITLRICNQTSRWLARSIETRERFGPADLLYGFDTASLETFRAASQSGAKLVLEQCVAPRNVQKETLSRVWKQAGATVSPSRIKAWDALAAREAAEWKMADLVVCPSSYVIESVKAAGVASTKLALVPYGVPPRPRDQVEQVVRCRHQDSARPLRVLFVGEVGLRKGILDVVEVARRLPQDEFTFVAAGPLRVPEHHRASVLAAVDWMGNLSPQELREQYIAADCLLLPSYLEGSATVTYEALAWALPVVTTHSAGTVVEHEVSGLIGNAGDIDFLVASLRRLRREAGLRAAMSASALARSGQFRLEDYRERLLGAVETLGADC